MNTERKRALAVGSLFLIAMAGSLVGAGIVGSCIDIKDFMLTLHGKNAEILLGISLELLNAIAVLGIAILMFPLLRKQNETMSTGYLAVRIVECVACSIIVISPLSLLSLSQAYMRSGFQNTDLYNIAASLSLAERSASVNILIPLFFCIGAFLLYAQLFQTRLLPRFFSVWGFIATALVLILNAAMLTGVNLGLMTNMILALPIILNEIVMGIWLIARGFDQPQEPILS